MITVSDNTATNMVLEKLLGRGSVNATLKKLGFEKTRSLKQIGIDPQSDPDAKTYGIGVTTPREMARFLEMMEHGELVDAEASHEMIRILKRQQDNKSLTRHLNGRESASKTGALDQLRADVATIYDKKGKLVIAMYCDKLKAIDWSPDNPAHVVMDQVARLLLEEML